MLVCICAPVKPTVLNVGVLGVPLQPTLLSVGVQDVPVQPAVLNVGVQGVPVQCWCVFVHLLSLLY